MWCEEGQFGEFVGFELGFEFEVFFRGLVREEEGAMVMKEERK